MKPEVRPGTSHDECTVGFAGIAALEKRSANVFLFDANVAADRLEQIANELDLKVCISAETLFLFWFHRQHHFNNQGTLID